LASSAHCPQTLNEIDLAISRNVERLPSHLLVI
jgi:hypothetical protein